MDMKRVWAMPNKNTFEIPPIGDIVRKYTHGKSIDPFANKNKFAMITNDLDTKYSTNYHMDALDFLKIFDDEDIDTVLYDPPYCYDKDTELLTKNGWKFFDDLTKDDIVATLNTTTNKLEYQKPEELIKKKYSGDMISFESQSVSLLVTPNHKMWTKHNFYGNYKFEDAVDVVDKKTWFQKACEYDGVEEEYFKLPTVELIKTNKHGEKSKPEKLIKMDTWLKFLGLYISEGCCKKSRIRKSGKRIGKTHHDYCVCLTQKKEHNLQIFEGVLDELGYKYYRDGVDYKIHDKQLWTFLNKYGHSHEKYIDDNIKDLSAQQLHILLKHLMIGDGTNITYPKFNKSAGKTYHYSTNSYYTNSVKLMNDVSEICIKCGYGITVRPNKKEGYKDVYNIHILKAKHFRVNKENIKIIDNFDDYILCICTKQNSFSEKKQ